MTLEEMKRKKSELGYSNERISKLSGVPLSTVQKIFSGITRQPRFDTIMALENILGTQAGRVEETSVEYIGKKQGEYTVADYFQMPDEKRIELIDGVIYDMTAPFIIHQFLISIIWKHLDSFIRKNNGNCIAMVAPVDVHLLKDSYTMVQPDSFIVCDRIKLNKRGVEGAPDFIIEILSPSTKKKDMFVKLNKYEEAGVREYWMVDPDTKKVVVYVFDEDMIPGVYTFADKIPVAIFAETA